MKVLFFISALFISALNYAQTITEAQLLGKWQVSYMALGGGSVDFETGTVTLPEDELEQLKKNGRDPEKEKKEVLSKLGGNTMLFIPDGKAIVAILNNQSETTYSLNNVDGKTFTQLLGTTMEVRISDGYLQFQYEEETDGTAILKYKKIPQQASQTITEADLLGEWRMAKMDFQGVLADLDTGEVTATQPAKEGSEAIKEMKQRLEKGAAESLKTNKMIFKPGFELTMTELSKVDNTTYTLSEESGVQFIHIKQGSGSIEFEVAFEDGLLLLRSMGRAASTMYLKRTK